jgi:tRNA/tmRNA/rRNA uracil-C5-methylase (TrmA/RlmC/RlmD family)
VKNHPTHPERAHCEIEISDVAFGGSGVGRANGKTTFVPYTIEGERVIAEIVEKKKHFDRARLTALLRPSSHRISPPCPYFGQCGGCDYQHIAYEEQLALKQKQVEQILKRIGRLDNIRVLPIIGSPEHFGFRNRITVHADEGKIGFFKKQSRAVLDIEQCAIASSDVNERLRELRLHGLPDGAHRTLREKVGSRTFTQTNDRVADLLLANVTESISGDVLLDLYCGSGFMGHALAERFQTVIGIDWSEPAILAARLTARANEIYIRDDVGKVLDATLKKYRPDAVIVDPSADGIDEQATASLSQNGPPAVVYVSCNPTTLARDLSRLSARYVIKSVQPFDMFPQTAEIEAVASLSRRDRRS